MTKPLALPLVEYFKYHPPLTEERRQKHSRVNEESLSVCKELMATSNPEKIEACYKQMLALIAAVCEDELCAGWANNAISRAAQSALIEEPTDVLMYIQQARMFMNQGITVDELKANLP